MTRALRNAALDYADRGWYVLPLRPRGKEPLGSRFKPQGPRNLVPHGKDEATNDLATVLRWWTQAPRANIAIVAGPSGLVVLDVDPRNGGDDHLFELERQLGPLPETVSAETGGGGWHYLFRHPGTTLVGKVAPPGVPVKDAGIDVQDHKYIVAPPSIHPSGRPYSWEIGPDEMEPADLPAAWLERLTSRHQTRSLDVSLNLDHDDPLRQLPAAVYVPRLTGRDVERGEWVRCPFHGGGDEAEPSLNVSGTIWACYGCPPAPGKRAMGGNIYDLAGILAGYALPLRGPDFMDIQARLMRVFS